MDARGVHRLLQGALSPPHLSIVFHADLPQLETDPALLIPKARGALARYGHQVVIGNDLHRRKYEVVLVTPTSPTPSPSPSPEPTNGAPGQEPPSGAELYSESWIRIDLAQNPKKEIEEDIVGELVKRHRMWTGEHTAEGS